MPNTKVMGGGTGVPLWGKKRKEVRGEKRIKNGIKRLKNNSENKEISKFLLIRIRNSVHKNQRNDSAVGQNSWFLYLNY